jgi:hypothetical protein
MNAFPANSFNGTPMGAIHFGGGGGARGGDSQQGLVQVAAMMVGLQGPAGGASTNGTSGAFTPSASMQHMAATMFWMSIGPLISAFIVYLSVNIQQFIKQMMGWMNKKVTVKMNDIEITQTIRMNTSRVYHDEDESRNCELILSVLDFLSKQQISMDSIKLNLKDDGVGATTNERYKKRTMHRLPQSSFNYDGMLITYDKDSKSKKADNQADSGDGKTPPKSTASEGENLTYTLKIESMKSVDEMERFVQQCYHQYIDKMHPIVEVQRKRYFYQQIKGRNGPLFKQYDLPPGKSAKRKNAAEGEDVPSALDRVYFDEKPRVVELLRKLNAGEIEKMAIIAAGEPGCGKTRTASLIAEEEDRDIVVVKLSLIESDDDIMDLFFNPYLSTTSSGNCFCPNNRRLYLFEDVDAETDIIHQRETAAEAAERKKREIATGTTKDATAMRSLFKIGFTLSGLLNALDGILRINKAIIYMTTNHMDKIDTALRRYGRFNLQIEMRRLRAEYAHQMIRRAFKSEVSVRADLIHDFQITPAHLEALCQSCESLEDLETELALIPKEGAALPATLLAASSVFAKKIDKDDAASPALDENSSDEDSSDDDMDKFRCNGCGKLPDNCNC